MTSVRYLGDKVVLADPRVRFKCAIGFATLKLVASLFDEC